MQNLHKINEIMLDKHAYKRYNPYTNVALFSYPSLCCEYWSLVFGNQIPFWHFAYNDFVASFSNQLNYA